MRRHALIGTAALAVLLPTLAHAETGTYIDTLIQTILDARPSHFASLLPPNAGNGLGFMVNPPQGMTCFYNTHLAASDTAPARANASCHTFGPPAMRTNEKALALFAQFKHAIKLAEPNWVWFKEAKPALNSRDMIYWGCPAQSNYFVCVEFTYGSDGSNAAELDISDTVFGGNGGEVVTARL